MIDLELDERLFQSYTCSFRILAQDPKAEYLVEDAMLEFEGDRFFITDVIKERDENEAYLSVVAESGWMRLADIKRPGSFNQTDVTVEEGLNQILSGTGWTISQVTDTPTTYSIEATDATVLDLLWQWAKITGCEIQFDTIPKTLVFIPAIGANRGLSFRYGRNLTKIKRTARAPKVTRLYAYGRNEIDVSDHNGGLPYIEDYSFYTAAGYTLEEAQENYRKDETWVDDSFIDTAALFAAAQARLATLSQPTLLYEASVLDLSEILDTVEGDFRPGDVVGVYDEILDINVQARVSRRVRYPHEPYKNKVELAFAPILLPDGNTSSARSNSTKAWELFESRNWETPRQVRGFSTILHRIVLNVVEGGEWVAGFKLQGVAVGASTLTIEATNDTDDTPVWTSFVEVLADGDAVNYNFTFGQKDIPAGEYIMVIRAFSDTLGAGINIAQTDTAYWFLARGTTRAGVTLANSIRYEHTGAIQYFVVPDDVHEVQIECVAASGGYNVYGGAGGKAIAKFPVVAGNTYDVYVGGMGSGGGSPGWPDGGTGGSTYASPRGAGGGGRSQVVASGGDLASSMIVAGAGGGCGDTFYLALQKGGAGGFFEGQRGILNSEDPPNGGLYPGYGATQDAGGAVGNAGASYPGTPGTFGQGGSAENVVNAFSFPPGGGGGGWYGGGAASGFGSSGSGLHGGGGGGSGWMGATGYDLEVVDAANEFADGYVVISWETPDSP